MNIYIFYVQGLIFKTPFLLCQYSLFLLLNIDASLHCFLFSLPNENSLFEPHGTSALEHSLECKVLQTGVGF